MFEKSQKDNAPVNNQLGDMVFQFLDATSSSPWWAGVQAGPPMPPHQIYHLTFPIGNISISTQYMISWAELL
jgi:hypothetical protein